MITFGSLFAGIGGFDLGLERCGMQCKWQVEIDDYATRILERHWPNVHRQRDIKQCGRHNLEWVDVICGGFPCQDISYAGKGAGLDGERSGLFFEAIRVVRELRPRAVVLENVAGLLTRGMDRVLGTMAEIGLDAEWHCIPASSVGAPHIRDRIFIIGTQHSNSDSFGLCANAKQRQKQQGADASRDSRAGHSSDFSNTNSWRQQELSKQDIDKKTSQQSSQWNNTGGLCEDVSGSEYLGQSSDGNTGNNSQECKAWKTNQHGICRRIHQRKWQFANWTAEPSMGELVNGVSGGLVRFIGRTANGIPNRVNKLRCLGNAIVPQVAEVVGRILLQRIGGEDDLLRD